MFVTGVQSHWRRVCERSFHRRGAATEKALSPYWRRRFCHRTGGEGSVTVLAEMVLSPYWRRRLCHRTGGDVSWQLSVENSMMNTMCCWAGRTRVGMSSSSVQAGFERRQKDLVLDTVAHLGTSRQYST